MNQVVPYEKRVSFKYASLRRNRPKTKRFKNQTFLVCFDKRHTLFHQKPIESGVYLLTTVKPGIKRKVWYIGSSGNISVRLSSHEVLRKMRNLLEVGEIVEILCYLTSDYISLEKQFIKKHKPALNVVYNRVNLAN